MKPDTFAQMLDAVAEAVPNVELDADLDRLLGSVDVATYELEGLADRIEASKKINNTPVKHPVRPLPKPKPAPKPKPPKDMVGVVIDIATKRLHPTKGESSEQRFAYTLAGFADMCESLAGLCDDDRFDIGERHPVTRTARIAAEVNRLLAQSVEAFSCRLID